VTVTVQAEPGSTVTGVENSGDPDNVTMGDGSAMLTSQ
jgi:hypothetical protein